MNPPKAFTRKPIGFGKQITTYSFNELNPDAVFISIQRTKIESKSQRRCKIKKNQLSINRGSKNQY